MNLPQLLIHRKALLRQARLANLAFAYTTLAAFAGRLERAGLRGAVRLMHSAPEAGQYWATLSVPGASPSVVEEHFTDEDAVELADVFAFVTGESELDLTFDAAGFAERFLTPLRRELEQAGIAIADAPPLPVDSSKGESGEN